MMWGDSMGYWKILLEMWLVGVGIYWALGLDKEDDNHEN